MFISFRVFFKVVFSFFLIPAYSILQVPPKLKPFEKEKASKVDEIANVKVAFAREKESKNDEIADVKAAYIEKEKVSKVDEIADVKTAGAAFEKEKATKFDEIADVKAAAHLTMIPKLIWQF